MPRIDFPQLLDGSNAMFSQAGDIEDTINLYLERIESGSGRNRYVMQLAQGLRIFTFATSSETAGRGMLELNDHLFSVQGGSIFEVLSDGTLHATYGTIPNDGQPVSIAATTDSLFVVTNQDIYVANSGVLTAPTLPFDARGIAVLDGFVFSLADDLTAQIFFSTDGLTWNALDYHTAEASANKLINLITDHQELWVFGNRVTQVFTVNATLAASGDPLQPIQSAVIQQGLAATFGLAQLDNSLFWLGRNRNGEHTVWRANGYTPTRVSTHAVENAFRSYPRHDDAIFSTYEQNGHACLRCTFPSANDGVGETWEYDVSVDKWTKVAWFNFVTGRYEQHRANFYASAFGKIIAQDHNNGLLYEMSPDFYTDFGYPIKWLRRTPHITKNNKFIKYQRMEIVFQAGVGGVDPVWINDHTLIPAAFASAVATLLGDGDITAGQADILQKIYDYEPYDQTVALPLKNTEIMEPLGFVDLAEDPRVAMRYSDDGGNTYTPITTRPMGKIGAYKTRAFWLRCGKGRDRVIEYSGNAPVKTAIVQGSFDAEECLS